jgi:hypothetical protein
VLREIGADAAVCIGAMMCSHTSDTTRPTANPEKPLAKPPANAARTKRVRIHHRFAPPKRGNEHLDGHPSDGEAPESPIGSLIEFLSS